MVKVNVSGGLRRKAVELLFKSTKLKNTFNVLGSSILVKSEDSEEVVKILKRNFIPYQI